MSKTRIYNLRAKLSTDEAKVWIEKFGSEYDTDERIGDVYDQLELCISLAESTPVNPDDYDGQIILNAKKLLPELDALVYGGVSDSSKRTENAWLSQAQLEAIVKIKQCRYRTPPIEIEKLLEIIFEGHNTSQGWWLAVAQQWNPKSISSVLAYMVKAQTERWKTFGNPAAYFTAAIKPHKKRKSVREKRSL